MTTRAELVRAATAGQAQSERLRRSTLSALERMWLSLPNYRDVDVDRFVAQALPIVNAGIKQTANLSAANITILSRLMTGERLAPAVLPDVSTATLRGVDAEIVYRRPAVTLYTALSKSEPFDRAVELGRQRLIDIVATDMQLAKTHTAQAVLAGDERVVGYRRVLEGSKNCGLCVVASTQRYHKGDLMPIHPGCDCGVAPIHGTEDPGQIINQGRLDAAHDAIAETFGAARLDARSDGSIPDYRDVLIVHQHGEIGPVLGVRGQHFVGPDDL